MAVHKVMKLGPLVYDIVNQAFFYFSMFEFNYL